jgi:chromate reductase
MDPPGTKSLTQKIIGLAVSLRPQSWNRLLLENVGRALVHHDLAFSVVDWSALPLFAGQEPTSAVEVFKAEIAAAQGVVISVPEFNHSVPGAFKNAVDWASRPAYKSVFAQKRVGILSAVPGVVGGVRAQAHLKNILLGMASLVFPAPEFAVGLVKEKISSEGEVLDPDLRRRIDRFARDFAAFVKKGEAT